MADPNTMLERAVAAIDDALIEQVKARFAIVIANQYGETPEAAFGQFAKGLGDLKVAHERARALVAKAFGGA
jgi:hypothetical protein